MLHGILLCDKPTGMTSHRLVDIVRKQLNQREVGHAGTLDPLATGLMLILLGEATKLSDYVLNDDKAYQVKVRFGLETDSWDADGETVFEEPFVIDESILKTQLSSVSGELKLSVPHFSAVKMDGQKMYQRARKKEVFETPVRPMNFWNVESQVESSSEASFQFQCSKGSFVRSWAMEIAKKLGTKGTVVQLRRTQSGPFSVQRAMGHEQLIQINNDELLTSEAFQPMDFCLADWPAIRVKGRDKKLLMNGQVPHEVSRRLVFEQKAANRLNESQNYRVLDGHKSALLALMEISPFRPIRIKRVFKHLDAPT